MKKKYAISDEELEGVNRGRDRAVKVGKGIKKGASFKGKELPKKFKRIGFSI